MEKEKFYSESLKHEFAEAVSVLNSVAIKPGTVEEKGELKTRVVLTYTVWANEKAFKEGAQQIGNKEEKILVSEKSAGQLRKFISELK